MKHAHIRFAAAIMLCFVLPCFSMSIKVDNLLADSDVLCTVYDRSDNKWQVTDELVRLPEAAGTVSFTIDSVPSADAFLLVRQQGNGFVGGFLNTLEANTKGMVQVGLPKNLTYVHMLVHTYSGCPFVKNSMNA